MAIKAFNRREIKCVAGERQAAELLGLIGQRMKPDKYCPDGRCYKIFNIYYDTRTNDVIRASLAKPYYKEKLRLRSYEIADSPQRQVFLELKKKIGSTVNKRRAQLTLNEAYDFLAKGKQPDTDDYLNRQVLGEIAWFLHTHDVYPVLFLCYSRMAFCGKEDNDLRVTLDSDLLARRYDLQLEKGCYGRPVLEPGKRIVEIKVAQAVPLWLASALSDLGLYKTSFSKYGTEYTSSIRLTQVPGALRRPLPLAQSAAAVILKKGETSCLTSFSAQPSATR